MNDYEAMLNSQRIDEDEKRRLLAQELRKPRAGQPEMAQQQQGQGMGNQMSSMANAYNTFGGGGGGAMTGGTQFASAGSAGTGGGMAGGPSMAGGSMGSAAGGGGSGLGSAAAAAGPWAALAAAIVGNEIWSNKEGLRDEDDKQYAMDLASGEVLNQDLEGRYLPMVGLKEGSKENELMSTQLNPVKGILHPKKTWNTIKKFF